MNPPEAAGHEDVQAAAEPAWRFGEFRLLPRRQLLLRDEQPVRIGGRALDLLCLLVKRRGEVVGKDELIRHAWPDVFVHESNLKVNIASLRRVLSQSPSEHGFIATVAGRGYRFVAPVRRDNSPLPPVATAPPKMPDSPNPIIGRQGEIQAVSERLLGRRMVTVVGPAGVGKTTVALGAARALDETFPDGVLFVDLAPIEDAGLVWTAIAAAAGAGANGADTAEGVIESLRGRRQLLVLDNCEHVAGAAALAATHLHRAVGDLCILATSRQPLGAAPGGVYRLAPLGYPPGDVGQMDAALRYPAVALLAARSREAGGPTLEDRDTPVVTELCRRLDGLPLAIELAASRMTPAGPADLLERLGTGLEALSSARPSAPARQKTLMATLDWSYRLLGEDEARVLRLLSVFAGPFTLEDAMALAGRLGTGPEDAAEAIGALAARSMLSAVSLAGAMSWRLLEVTRVYAAGRLERDGERPAAEAAHAAWLTALLERGAGEWQWLVAEEWTARYAPRINDLRRAIDWAFSPSGEPLTGLRLTAAAIALWDELSAVGEARLRVRTALNVARELDGGDPSLLMKLTMAWAWSLTFGDRLGPEAEAAWLESLRLAQQAGDTDYQLRALWGFAVLQSFTGRHRQALATLCRFGAIAAQNNDRSAAAAGERLQLITAFYRGEITSSHEALEDLARRHDRAAPRARLSRFQIDRYVSIRVSLAVAAFVRGRTGEATQALAGALEGALTINHVVSHSNALAFAAIPLSLWLGDTDAADLHLAALVHNINQRELVIWEPLARFFGAAIAHARGEAGAAETMSQALDALTDGGFVVRMPLYRAMLAQVWLAEGRLPQAAASVAQAQAQLGEQGEAWCAGEVLRVRAAVELARGDGRGAERTLLEAIGEAARTDALFFELRAANALADLWIGTGRSARAADLLAPLCRRFSRGADFPDLARARRLVDSLQAQGGEAVSPAC